MVFRRGGHGDLGVPLANGGGQRRFVLHGRRHGGHGAVLRVVTSRLGRLPGGGNGGTQGLLFGLGGGWWFVRFHRVRGSTTGTGGFGRGGWCRFVASFGPPGIATVGRGH